MKTKTSQYLKLIAFYFCLIAQSNYAQFLTPQIPRHIFTINPDHAIRLVEHGVDTTNVDSVKFALNGTDLYLSTLAADFFAYRKMTNFISDIRNRYAVENNFSQEGFDYLGALYNLGAPDIQVLLNNFVDSIHTQFVLNNKDYNKLSEKKYFAAYAVWCIGVLCEFGDYSQFNSLIDFLGDTSPIWGGVGELNKFIRKVDQNSENIIYTRLLMYTTNSFDRYQAVTGLNSYLDRPETFSTLLNVALFDSSDEVRSLAEDILLQKFHHRREVFDLVVKRIYNEDGKSGPYGQGAALGHLAKFSYPEVLTVFKNVAQNVIFSDPEDHEMAQDSYDYYEPPRPDSTVTVISMIDSLSSLITQTTQLNWLGLSSFSSQLQTHLNTAKVKLQGGDSIGCYQSIKQFQNAIDAEYKDTLNQTTNFVTVEGWKFLYYNAQYILDRLPKPPPPSLVAALKNSTGTKLSGGTLQYYDASPNGAGWKDAVNNNDGTFSINTTKTSLSLRMTYAYGSQQKSNVAVNSDTVIFQTVNAQVQLKNSSGTLLDTGTVQYYAGAWRTFGTTSNGIAAKELLASSYSFRMTYGYASNDTVQDLNTNPTVVFKTTNAQVQLKNSLGDLIDQGTVQYYSGAWRIFGTTSNGVASKELLPTNYSFRMTYAYGSNDKAQNIKTSPIVLFQTTNAQVQLKNSQGSFIDQGTVQYYSGAWRTFGTTSNGVATKELLPNSYQFRLTHEYVSNDKTQNVGSDNTVIFSTVPATVQVKNSQNNPVNNAVVTYYSGAWRSFGTTANGQAVKELLPVNLQFRAKLGTAQADKTQNLLTNPLVEIQLNAAQ